MNIEGALGGAGAGAGIGGAIGGPWGAGIGAVAGGIGGLFLPSSGGGISKGEIKSIARIMDELVGQARNAAALLSSQSAGFASKAKKEVEKYGNDLRSASDAETKTYWNNLGIFNEGLINTASALVDTYDGDVTKALETLVSTVEKLNEGYASDMGAEISRYGSVEDAINAQLASDKDVAETKFLERVNQNKAEYEQKSLSEVDAAKAEQMSLGDTFMQQSNDALGRYDNFISQANTTSMLDALSKNVQKTRLDLIATADPRAAELSAIADENAAALMSGRISADVQANLARSGAMRALQGGFGADSGMGRNLQARDLGLTSLDLMGKGYDMFDRQRRLNYDTKVAGVQDTAANVFDTMRAGESEMLRNTLATAESDRNQRVGAVQEASGQRLQTYDRLFGANNAVADTLRGQDMTLAGQLSDNSRDRNIRESGMRMAATQDIYNNVIGLSDTVFNSRIGLAGQKFSTGLSVVGDVYKTNTSATDSIYKTRLGLEQSIFGRKTDTSIAAMDAENLAAISAFEGITNVLSSAAGTKANLPIINAASRNASAMQSAQLWGSALQAGSSLAGSYLGNANWNPGGRSFGGGYKNPYGYGNFDMGSGTGA